jgi:hypothetical protein
VITEYGAQKMINFTLGFIAGMLTIVGLIWFALGSDK